jgi:hypothetical protein
MSQVFNYTLGIFLNSGNQEVTVNMRQMDLTFPGVAQVKIFVDSNKII